MSEMVRRPRILSAASAALIIGQAMAKMSGAALAEFKSGLKIKPSRSKSKGLKRYRITTGWYGRTKTQAKEMARRCKQIERGLENEK